MNMTIDYEMMQYSRVTVMQSWFRCAKSRLRKTTERRRQVDASSRREALGGRFSGHALTLFRLASRARVRDGVVETGQVLHPL
jgi:hypothetical protein